MVDSGAMKVPPEFVLYTRTSEVSLLRIIHLGPLGLVLDDVDFDRITPACQFQPEKLEVIDATL